MSQKPYLSEDDKPLVAQVLAQRRVVDPVTGCWIWTGSRILAGYGRIHMKWRQYVISRLSAWLYLGMKLEDRNTYACHKCDNPPCFNPEHLFLGTSKDNQLDSLRKGRAKCLRGEKSKSAKLNRFRVQRIALLCGIGVPQRVIADLFGVSQSNVYSISTGRIWKHLQLPLPAPNPS